MRRHKKCHVQCIHLQNKTLSEMADPKMSEFEANNCFVLIFIVHACDINNIK